MEDIRRLEIVEREGQVGNAFIVGLVVTGVAMVVLPLIFYIVASVTNVIPTTGLDANQTAALNVIKNGQATNFSLLNIGIAIAAASIALGTLVGLIAFFAR